MNLAEVLFLSAMSLLLVSLAAFTVVVALSAMRATGQSIAQLPGVRATLRALELSPGSEAVGGRLSFYLHRLSGVGVLGFLALHVVDVSLFAFSANLYNHVHRLYGTSGLRILECGLVFAVLFHALNGLRLLAIDGLDLSMRAAQRLLILVAVLTVGAGLISSVIILAPIA